MEVLSRIVDPGPFQSSSRLLRVQRYVEDHYGEPIDLPDVADVAAMETSAFCRYFKQKVGITFCDWLSRRRLVEAIDLIEAEVDLNLTEIAFEVGFGNLRSFQRLFKRHLGITPTAARDSLQGPDCEELAM